MPRPRFHRILLKLSGEALMGEGQFGIDPDAVSRLAEEIKSAVADGQSCASSSAAATSSAASPGRRRASTARPPIIWACWRR
jgi:hypothetical protein